MNFDRLIKNLFVIAFSFLVLACSKRVNVTEVVEVKGNDVLVTHVDQITDTIDLLLSELVESCDIVPLETNNESLISFANRVSISDHYIAVKDIEHIPVKLFSRDGKYLREIGGIGRGPDEYNVGLYGLQIDEINENIYLFPAGRTRRILVFGLDGKARTHIPLRYLQRKFKAYIEDGIVTVLGMPLKNDTAIVFQQTIEGDLIQFITPKEYQFANDYSSEITSSKISGSYSFFQMHPGKTPYDTLYHYNTNRNELVPKFTLEFNAEQWPVYSCLELPNHFMAYISRRGSIVIDKISKRTNYFRLINDFCGGINFQYFEINEGMLIGKISALDLKKEIKKCMDEIQDDKTKMKLTELNSDLSENSNDIIFFGKLKQQQLNPRNSY